MPEKKIFLAYTYRSLQVLYAYLYKVRADLVFDNIYAYHEDRQCSHKDYLISSEANLLLHYNTVLKMQKLYNTPPLNRGANDIIVKLLNNEIPTIEEGIKSGLIKYSVDIYNPVFAPYLT